MLADDHKILRTGIREMLEKQTDIQVVGEAEDGKTAVKLAMELNPDIIIMDIAMPDLNGIEATYQITSSNKNIKVIALSMYADRRFVRGMLKAGAIGYLLKDCALEDLMSAIKAAVENRVFMSPKIADIIVKNHIQQLKKTDFSVYSVLSSRERQVLQLLAEGSSTREISEKLSISIKTVETHRQQIMGKLNINNIAGLTKYSIKEGLTSLET